jgi:hypothetical protein
MNKNALFGVLFVAAGTVVFGDICSSSKKDIILSEYQTNQHLPEEPPYQDSVRMELIQDSTIIATTQMNRMTLTFNSPYKTAP